MLKKIIFSILAVGLVLAQELEVEGNLKVTGTVESTTIDSILGVIANMQAAHQAEIESLQAQIDVLANSAVNVEFTEIEVFNGTPTDDEWIELDLSNVVGQKESLVLLTVQPQELNGRFHYRTNGEESEGHSTWIDFSGVMYLMIMTDSNGIVEWKFTWDSRLLTPNISIIVSFYLNQ